MAPSPLSMSTRRRAARPEAPSHPRGDGAVGRDGGDGEGRPGAAGAPRLRRGRRIVRRALAAAVLVVVGYLGVVAVQVEVASRRDIEHPAGAAVVMGAAQYDGTPSGALAGRLDRAAQLYEQGLVSTVVVTGGSQPGDRTSEGMTGFVYLRQRGVPEAALLVENTSTNTWEQLLATKLILDEHGIESAVLVSDPYHNRRLLDTAGELGIDAQVSAADSSVGWRDLTRETLGVAAGKLIGFRRLAQL